MKMRSHLYLIGLCLLLSAAPVQAGKWPRPAGGPAAGAEPELLLTFDDGPHETHTERILDTLAERGLKAIFFWTGHRVTNSSKGLSKRQALVERAVREGHLIGNHTISHAKLCSVSAEQAGQEIDDNALLYTKLTGLPLFLMRVPYGARCKRLDAMLSERAIEHMHWDLDPQEFRHRSADVAFSYVTRRLRRLEPGARAILLMHDTQPATAKALPKILDWIDDENAQRVARGKLPIRIISGSAYVEEKYPVPLLDWSRNSLGLAQAAISTSIAQLWPALRL